MHSDYTQTPVPDSSAAPGRLRAQDWWRWVTLIPVLGTTAASLALLGRKRRGWAGLLLLITITGASTLGLGFRRIHDSGFTFGGSPAGGLISARMSPFDYELGRALIVFAALLWPLSIIAGWLAPNDFAGTPRRPWPEVTERARALTLRYGVTAYVVCVGTVLGVGAILTASHADSSIALSVLPVDAILLAGLMPLILRRRIGFRDLGLCRTRAGAGAALAVSTLFTYLVLSLGYGLLFVATSTQTGPFASPDGLTVTPGGGASILDVLALAVAAPVCEELFFRGLLYRSLRNRMPMWAAALIAGCLFGLAHVGSYPLATIPVKMLFGVLMCLLYERTRSLLPGIAVHIAVDGTAADVLVTGNVYAVLIAGAVALVAVLMRVIYNAIRDERRDLTVDRSPRSGTAASGPAARPSPSARGAVPA